MTSNAGSDKLSNSSRIGYFDSKEIDHDMVSKTLRAQLKKIMKPELINRVDEIVVFNDLTIEVLEKITKIKLLEVAVRLSDNNIVFEIDDELIKHLAKTTFLKKAGARPLARLIDEAICDLFAENILSGDLVPGDEVLLKYDSITETVGYTKA